MLLISLKFGIVVLKPTSGGFGLMRQSLCPNSTSLLGSSNEFFKNESTLSFEHSNLPLLLSPRSLQAKPNGSEIKEVLFLARSFLLRRCPDLRSVLGFPLKISHSSVRAERSSSLAFLNCFIRILILALTSLFFLQVCFKWRPSLFFRSGQIALKYSRRWVYSGY